MHSDWNTIFATSSLGIVLISLSTNVSFLVWRTDRLSANHLYGTYWEHYLQLLLVRLFMEICVLHSKQVDRFS